MKIIKMSLLLALLLAGIACQQKQSEESETNQEKSPSLSVEELEDNQLTYPELVYRMTKPEYLATLPPVGESSAMISTWNRDSRYDEATGKYIMWAQNNDGGVPDDIKKEGENLVLAELEGPGCIWRIWSARPEEGHLKIFIDGAESPILDMPFRDYFTGTTPPFDFPGMAYEAARGMNLYVPITYQKSIKIVAEPGWGSFYQFNYTTFPEGTEVPTFTVPLSDEARSALEKADKVFAQLGQYPCPANEISKKEAQKVSIEPGQQISVKLEGEAAIKSIRVTPEFKDSLESVDGLRELAISIYWDGEEQPSVWSPLGDFFATCMGMHNYTTLPTGVVDGSMYAYWYMPFGKGAEIVLSNDGQKSYTLSYEIGYGPLKRDISRYGRFHAKWHRDVMPVSEDRWPDWTVVKTQGRGRFAGFMLHVWNPKGGMQKTPKILEYKGHFWWGEGDEKFFVDGEKMPSTYGTGTEDYFGYAWGDDSFFEKVYHAQSFTQLNAGNQVLKRWQFGDNVPFQTSFEAYLEKYFTNEYPTQYACLPVWYLSTDGTDPHTALPVEERVAYQTPIDFKPVYIDGAIELEAQPLIEEKGLFEKDLMPGNGYDFYEISNNGMLKWYGKTDAEEMSFSIKVNIEKDGTYALSGQFIKYNLYGIVQVSIDGRPVGQPIDLYSSEEFGEAVTLDIGQLELEAGRHKVTFAIVGQNPAIGPETEKLGMVVDYIKLEKAE